MTASPRPRRNARSIASSKVHLRNGSRGPVVGPDDIGRRGRSLVVVSQRVPKSRRLDDIIAGAKSVRSVPQKGVGHSDTESDGPIPKVNSVDSLSQPILRNASGVACMLKLLMLITQVCCAVCSL